MGTRPLSLPAIRGLPLFAQRMLIALLRPLIGSADLDVDVARRAQWLLMALEGNHDYR